DEGQVPPVWHAVEDEVQSALTPDTPPESPLQSHDQSMVSDGGQIAGDDGHETVDAAAIGVLFVKEVVGGAVLGLVLGYVTFLLLRSVDNYQVEILLSLALVFGGYALAYTWHLSGPI